MADLSHWINLRAKKQLKIPLQPLTKGNTICYPYKIRGGDMPSKVCKMHYNAHNMMSNKTVYKTIYVVEFYVTLFLYSYTGLQYSHIEKGQNGNRVIPEW